MQKSQQFFLLIYVLAVILFSGSVDASSPANLRKFFIVSYRSRRPVKAISVKQKNAVIDLQRITEQLEKEIDVPVCAEFERISYAGFYGKDSSSVAALFVDESGHVLKIEKGLRNGFFLCMLKAGQISAFYECQNGRRI